MEEIIKLLAKKGVISTSDIESKLGISDFILKSILIALEKQGYIKNTQLSGIGSRCNIGCHHCNKLPTNNEINPSSLKIWMLTEKGSLFAKS